MRKLTMLIVLAVLALVVVGAVFLAAWDIPAPVAKVDKVIPDDRFPR